MSMSKKDYQAIARAIYEARKDDALDHWDGDITGNIGVSVVVQAIAEVMQRDNSRFDRALFLEACETGACRGMRRMKGGR